MIGYSKTIATLFSPCRLSSTKIFVIPLLGTFFNPTIAFVTRSVLSMLHCNDVIMTTIASQITSLAVIYSTVYSDADQRKHQSSALLAFVWGIHRDRWIPRTKGRLRGKCFHLMTSSWVESYPHLAWGQRRVSLTNGNTVYQLSVHLRFQWDVLILKCIDYFPTYTSVALM